MTSRSIEFGSFTLDLDRLCLRGPSGQADLRPKSFEVLRYLAQCAGRVVTKDELIKAVWRDVNVSDESLAVCISEVRRALGDKHQQIIKTLPKRGYLMDVAVATTVDPVTPPLSLPDQPSVAVLPFTNMSGDPEQEYFADGIVEDITTELSRFQDLFVIARNSSFRFKGRASDVRQVARELGVRYILEGSVRRDGDQVRISAQLIDAMTGGHRWAERYDRNLKDIFAVQDEVACTIATILVAHVRRADLERRINKPPSAWEAYDYFAQAHRAGVRYLSSYKADDLYQARKFLERSLSIDPAFARAYAALSFNYATAWALRYDSDYLNPHTLEHAYELAERALQIDSNLPLAHASLGVILMWKGQHDASVAAFDKALMINPNFTDWRFIAALVYAGELDRLSTAPVPLCDSIRSIPPSHLAGPGSPSISQETIAGPSRSCGKLRPELPI